MIPLPPPLPSATTVHIPVIIAVLTEGCGVGLAVGLVFGLCSLIRAWETGMIGLTLFFRNPLISVLPRLLMPLIALCAWKLWQQFARDKAPRIGAVFASVVATFANTILCLSGIWLLYGDELTVLINGMIQTGNAEAAYQNSAGAWLIAAVGVPNGIAETIAAAVIVPLVLTAVSAVLHRKPSTKGRVK